MVKNVFSLITWILLSLVSVVAQDVETEFSWPMEIEGKKGHVTTLYQPQLESFEGNVLSGRMALTVKPKDGEIVFGAIWFEAKVETDFESRLVRLNSIDITNTNFPEMVEEEKVQKFTDILAEEIESWDIIMSLDQITASLEEVEGLKQLSDQINNDPPKIYFRTNPSVLVMIDGEPITKKDEETGLEYVVNTPFFIVKDKKGNYYINGGKFWYTSTSSTGNFKETNTVPKEVESFAKNNQEDTEVDSVALEMNAAPEIIVSTKAAELIVVDGDPEYKPIEGTNLLFVNNTESDVIMDVNSQNHFILLAGRWYYSKSLNDGDWQFMEPNDLPKDFSKIPEDSDMGNVLVSVPGTSQAENAVLEQTIPQTATVDRKEAQIKVNYDGDPKFEDVTGTNLKYAVNADKTVLLAEGKYYAIEDAIWFVSGSAKGPWVVSTERPNGVDEIPPESPVYNVKYVYIYDYTSEVVYVGYTPGYTYCYVYNGVVVYGTGYYYQPWYGYYYYPRPVTYGYGVHYNPYTGWGFTVHVSYGWVHWRYHPYHRRYWGARGYHRGYRHGYRRGYHHGYHRGYRNGYRAGYAAGSRNSNVYKNHHSGVRSTGNVNRGNNHAVNNKARPSTQPNNMYTDKKGNVYQRDKSGNYQNRSNAQNANKAQQPSQKPSGSTQNRPQQPSKNQQQLERSHQSRNQGSQNYQRSQQYQRQSQSRSYQGGGARGGARGGSGGRRR